MGMLPFQVSASDSSTFGVMVVILGGVALLAIYVMARKATKLDHLIALKVDWSAALVANNSHGENW